MTAFLRSCWCSCLIRAIKIARFEISIPRERRRQSDLAFHNFVACRTRFFGICVSYRFCDFNGCLTCFASIIVASHLIVRWKEQKNRNNDTQQKYNSKDFENNHATALSKRSLIDTSCEYESGIFTSFTKLVSSTSQIERMYRSVSAWSTPIASQVSCGLLTRTWSNAFICPTRKTFLPSNLSYVSVSDFHRVDLFVYIPLRL